jgi:electron transport complex protein RnfC
MGLLSFKGGIHPPHAKSMTEGLPIETFKDVDVVTIAMRQHIGAPCEPMVKKGDRVLVGQKIGEQTSFVGAPVHASVSGTVQAVKEMAVPGGKAMCVVIENDKQYEVHESVVPKKDLSELTKEEILEIVKEAGLVGMGGAGFPTHVKLSPPPDKHIDTLILNGAECEPYLTPDHRLMLEMPEKVVFGAEALMKALDLDKAYIGIENNKPDAIKTMKKAAEGKPVEIVTLETKYPQGAEKQLIYAVTKREVPSGGLPMEAGAVVNNVATAAALADAIQTGMPLVERICTVTGAGVQTPKNLRIRVGTNVGEILAHCGGYKGDKGKLIMGGPMMGMAQSSDDIPSTKTTSGLLVFPEEEAIIADPENCIKCGKCVDICPAFLQPVYLSAYSLKQDFDKAESYRALDCIECGSCSFICPSKRPLLHSIRVAKREILAKKRASK